MKGLEPPRLTAPDPKSGVATNYTTSADKERYSSFLMSANIKTFFLPNQIFFSTSFNFCKIDCPLSFSVQFYYFYTITNYIMELQGTVKKITDIQTFASGFQKREMILMTEEQYPQPISIEFLQDKTDLLNQVNEGDKVKVSINIRGREWTSPQNEVKYFNSIVGWRIENMAATFNEPTQAAPSQNQPAQGGNVFEEDEDDLPF